MLFLKDIFDDNETKTGRINFAGTGLYLSFAMQRWVKDSDELAKFDSDKRELG